jgi:hypothetical protein
MLPLQILVTAETRKQPEGFKGVYKELNRIIAAAEADPRKFSGFEKHWHPQKVSWVLRCSPWQQAVPISAAAVVIGRVGILAHRFHATHAHCDHLQPPMCERDNKC